MFLVNNSQYWQSLIHTSVQKGHEKSIAGVRVCTIALRVYSKSLLSRLVQEPSFYAISGLRHEGKCKLHLIIGTFCTSDYENQGIGTT